uniref:VWFC domain-containing protein n=1 Tax=Glossina brevipalpis TaxID=37001 RepID=A0A1A9X1S7_9MUSC
MNKIERKCLKHLGFDVQVCAILAFLMIPLVTETAPLQEYTEMQQYTEGCYYNYNHYNEGDRIITNEPCLNCTCRNKMLMCYLRVCPFTKPIGHDCIVEKREDQCCPIITCPEVPVDVAHNAIASDTQLNVPGKYGCNLNGNFYPEGAQVPSNPNTPCELCYCIKNRTSCLMQECTLHIEGCTPIYNRGSCCPIRYNCDHEKDVFELEDNYSTTFITTEQTTERPTPGFILTTTVSAMSTKCMQNGQLYADGSRVPGENACQNCYCMRGDIICAVQECKRPLLASNGKICKVVPSSAEGECCFNNYVCEDDSPAYQSLDTTTLPYSNLDEKVGDISPIPFEDLHNLEKDKVGDISPIPIEDLHSSISEDDMRLQAHIDKDESKEVHRDKSINADYENLGLITEFSTTDNPIQNTTYDDSRYSPSEVMEQSEDVTDASTKNSGEPYTTTEQDAIKEKIVVEKEEEKESEKDIDELISETTSSEDYITTEGTSTIPTEKLTAHEKDEIDDSNTTTELFAKAHSITIDQGNMPFVVDNSENYLTSAITNANELTTTSLVDQEQQTTDHVKEIEDNEQFTKSPEFVGKFEIKDLKTEESEYEIPHDVEDETQIKTLNGDENTDNIASTRNEFESSTESLNIEKITLDTNMETFLETNKYSENSMKDIISKKTTKTYPETFQRTELNTAPPAIYDEQNLNKYDKNIENIKLTDEATVASEDNVTVGQSFVTYATDIPNKSQYFESDNQVTSIPEKLSKSEPDPEAGEDEQTSDDYIHITKSPGAEKSDFIEDKHKEFKEYTSEASMFTDAIKLITKSTIFETTNEESYPQKTDEGILASSNEENISSKTTKSIQDDKIYKTTPWNRETTQSHWYEEEIETSTKTVKTYASQNEDKYFSEESTNNENLLTESQTTESIPETEEEKAEVVLNFTNAREQPKISEKVSEMTFSMSEAETSTQILSTDIEQVTNPSIGDKEEDIGKENVETDLHKPTEINEKMSSFYTSEDFSDYTTQASTLNTTALEYIQENISRTSEKSKEESSFTETTSDENANESIESLEKSTTYERPTKSMVIEEQPNEITQQHYVKETTTETLEAATTESEDADVLTKDSNSDPEKKDKQAELHVYKEYELTEMPFEENQSHEIVKENETKTLKIEDRISTIQPLEATSESRDSSSWSTEISDYDSVGYSSEAFDISNVSDEDDMHLTTTEEMPSDAVKKTEFSILDEDIKFISTEPSRVNTKSDASDGNEIMQTTIAEEIVRSTTEAVVYNQSDNFLEIYSGNFELNSKTTASRPDDESRLITTDKMLLDKTSSSTLPTLPLQMFVDKKESNAWIENDDLKIEQATKEPLESIENAMSTNDITTTFEDTINLNEQYTTTINPLQRPAQIHQKKENVTSTVETITPPHVSSGEISDVHMSSTIPGKKDDMTSSVKSIIPPHVSSEQISDVHLPPIIPGEGSCLVDTKTYTNNATVPISNECEISCKCVNSVVICERMHCNIPKNVNGCIIHEDKSDKCCPIYVCDTVSIPSKTDYVTESIEYYENDLNLSEALNTEAAFVTDKTQSKTSSLEGISTISFVDDDVVMRSTKKPLIYENEPTEEHEKITKTIFTNTQEIENKYSISQTSTQKPDEEYGTNISTTLQADNEPGYVDALLHQANTTMETRSSTPTFDQLTTSMPMDTYNADVSKDIKEFVTTEVNMMFKPSELSISTFDASATNTESQHITDSSASFIETETKPDTNIFNVENPNDNDSTSEDNTSDSTSEDNTSDSLSSTFPDLINSIQQEQLRPSEKNTNEEIYEGTTTLRTLENSELLTTRLVGTSQETFEDLSMNTHRNAETGTLSLTNESRKEEMSTAIPTTDFVPVNGNNSILDIYEFEITEPTDKNLIEIEKKLSEQKDLNTENEFSTTDHGMFTVGTFTTLDENLMPQKTVNVTPQNSLNEIAKKINTEKKDQLSVNEIIEEKDQSAMNEIAGEKDQSSVNEIKEEKDQSSANEIIEHAVIEGDGLEIETGHSTVKIPSWKVDPEHRSEQPSSTLISTLYESTTQSNFEKDEIATSKSDMLELTTPTEVHTMFESENMVTSSLGSTTNWLKEEINETSLPENGFISNLKYFANTTTQPIIENVKEFNNISSLEADEKKTFYTNAELTTRAVPEIDQYPPTETIEQPNITTTNLEEKTKIDDSNEGLIKHVTEKNDLKNIEEKNLTLFTAASDLKSEPDYTTAHNSPDTGSHEMITKLTTVTPKGIEHIEKVEPSEGTPESQNQILENLYGLYGITTTKDNILTENINKNTVSHDTSDEKTDQDVFSSTKYPFLSYHIATDKPLKLSDQNPTKGEKHGPHSTDRILTEASPEILTTTTTTTALPMTTTTLSTTQYPQQPAIYGQHPQYPSYPEDEYTDEDETEIFGPGTCRYGGKLYVSAQQIPRDDPCDFCFCFRSDIICLQQSCPPPITGCHEEPISGFCCPRYECPVSMATVLNITTSTTTTSTTLPPHFLHHSYGNTVQRTGCLINGRSYRVGDKIESTSGPCINCTCGDDGKMKCDPQACIPEPTMQQVMAVVAASHKR